MHRTQIQLEERQYRFLKARAKHKGKSLSALIRELVDEEMHQETAGNDPLLDILGMAEGPKGATARQHDRYLYGSRKK